MYLHIIQVIKKTNKQQASVSSQNPHGPPTKTKLLGKMLMVNEGKCSQKKQFDGSDALHNPNFWAKIFIASKKHIVKAL